MFDVKKIYEGSNNIVLVDEETGLDEVTLKWDGCIDYTVKNVMDESQGDYIHICDIDRAIEKLEALREIGIKHFGDKW